MKNLFILLVGSILVSCGGGGGEPGEVPITSIELKVVRVLIANDLNSTTTAEFTASAAWTIDVAQPAWFDVTPKNGSAGAVKITITATEANPSAANRYADIAIKCGSVTKRITVTQKENTLTVDKSTISLNSLTKSFKITSNIDWNITGLDGQNWCSVTPTSGTAGVTEITVTAASKNTTQSDRTLTLQVVSGSITQHVAVIQPCAYEDGAYMLYQDNSKGNKPIYLVFMGDGYIEEDHVVGGDFDKHLDEGIEALFAIEPYKTYREYFKVYKVAAHSQERGMSGGKRGTRNTKFKTNQADANATSLTCSYNLVFQYALKIPEITSLVDLTVALIVNENQYAGSCYWWGEDGKSLAMVPVSRYYIENYTFANTIMHEAGGHGFGQLGDEYITDNTIITSNRVTKFREAEVYGQCKNLDLTDNRDQVKWKSFFTEPGYSAVDIFEGGYYHAYGVWRPEQSSCMINNVRYYNAPSREAIVQRIMKLSGGTYNRADFIANDKQKSLPAAMQRLNRIIDQTPFIPLGEPIKMD